MHGVYNRGDGGAFQKLFIASVAASMKKYAIGLIDRRFSATRYDVRTNTVRQGSTVTMANILMDCFTSYSSGDDSAVVQFMDQIKYSDGLYLLGTASKLLWGITKFMYITLGPSMSRIGVDGYLRNRGYSEHQLANVRRFWGDLFRPLFLRFVMSFLAPPPPEEEQTDEDEDIFNKLHGVIQSGVDAILDNRLTDVLSDFMTDIYIAGANMLPYAPFMPGSDATISDDEILTREHLNETVKKARKNPNTRAFGIKGILYYQFYRGLLEQKAYEVTRPYSMFTEYQGLTDSLLPGLTAIFDIFTTISVVASTVDEDDLKAMPYQEQKKYHNGREIYTRGRNKDWYKWAKKVMRVSIMRTPEMWLDGYASYESMKHFKEPFDKDKYQEGIFYINRR